MVVAEHRRSAGGASIGYAVITVSDTRTLETDRGGETLAARVRAAGGTVAQRRIVHDEEAEIRRAIVEALAHPGTDIVLVTGGTGIAPRDVTVEAARTLLDRELPGFGELFRMLSWEQIGPAAMLSRATAGVAGGKTIFLLPGSPDALELAMDRLILPEAAHLLAQARRA